MFDVLNERLVNEGKDPIAFDHDCREGICGACSMYVDGGHMAHGRKILFANCTCAHIKMVIQLLWNHGDHQLFRL